ncbi:MAG: hypothetical protein RL095_2543 [Verrucomicrobiota bacterium]|jgi:hypothetical protein
MITQILISLLLQAEAAPPPVPTPVPVAGGDEKSDHKAKLMNQIRSHLAEKDPARLAQLQEMVWSDPFGFQREIQKVATEMRSLGLLAQEKRHDSWSRDGEGRSRPDGRGDGEERFTKDPILAARLKKLRQEDPDKFRQEIRRLMEERKNKSADLGVQKSSEDLQSAIKNWREAPPESKDAALIQLRTAVTAHFDADFKAKENCAERISKETQRIKADLEKRRAERESRIEEMLTRITSES